MRNISGVVTLCAPRARARAVFGPDKCKDLCGHGQFFIAKCARESWGTPSFKNVTTPLVTQKRVPTFGLP